MPPTSDEVGYLKQLVAGLEKRIEQLELGQRTTPEEQLRMILMGPPGAGRASADVL